LAYAAPEERTTHDPLDAIEEQHCFAKLKRLVSL
jgi:hypothetical protein